MQAIILAAGYATRLYPLTKDFPKALLTVGGMPLLDHILKKLNDIPEITDVHIVSNDRFYSQFCAWAEQKHDAHLHIYNDGTRDDDTKRGAIGDIAFVLKAASIDEDCLIVAGDNLLMIDYAEFYAAYLAHDRAPLLLAQKMQDKTMLKRVAVAVLDENDRVTKLIEKPQVPPSDNGVFALYLYPASVIRKIAEYLAQGNSPDAPGNYPVWLAERMPVYAYVTSAPCYDIGTHESLAEVRALYGN